MDSIVKMFKDQSKLVQVLLLLVPFVNWFFELVLRFNSALKDKNIIKLIFAVIVVFGGAIIGWLDAIWVALTGHLILE